MAKKIDSQSMEIPFSIPMQKQRNNQTVKSIVRESGVELIPDSMNNVEIEPGIKRVWATIWGFNLGELTRVKVDGLGRVIVSDGFAPNDVCQVSTDTLIGPTYSVTVTLSRPCHTIQVYVEKDIANCSFGLVTGSYPHVLLGTPFAPIIAGWNPGSMVTYKGLAKIVVVNGLIASMDSTIVVVGHSNP